MTLAVTPIYAALVALVFLVLSVRVILYRGQLKLSLGDGGDRQMLKRIRAQANCAEYAPVGLLLMLIAELQGAPAVALHVLGLMLLGGRILHGFGLSASPQKPGLRAGGMALTLGMIALAALAVLGHALI